MMDWFHTTNIRHVDLNKGIDVTHLGILVLNGTVRCPECGSEHSVERPTHARPKD